MGKNNSRRISFRITQEEYDKLKELAENLEIGRGGVSRTAKLAVQKVVKDKIKEGVITE